MDNLTLQFSWYGHYKMFTSYYNKEISLTTDNMPLIDDIKDGEKSAIKQAKKMIINNYKNSL